MIVIAVSNNSIPKWIIFLIIPNDQILWNVPEKTAQLCIFFKHKKIFSLCI
jgi:hypothetical protein